MENAIYIGMRLFNKNKNDDVSWHLWRNVAYDVCRLMMFVAYDVFECVAYRACRSAQKKDKDRR